MKKRKKNRALGTVLLVLALLAGLVLLLYPTVSNTWNALHQARAISDYVEKTESLTEEEFAEYWEAAREYNARIPERSNVFRPDAGEEQAYAGLLNIGGDGVMGYLEIPSIEVTLPLCHGTGDSVLQHSAGHLEWTSLPVGGEGTHCVISGHRGLPSARLFTDLDEMETGDVFVLRILDDVLTYEVDRILIVEPDDSEPLKIVPGEDYCTLLTCTPYGINTHRLLVRGHRIANREEAVSVRITSDAVQIEPLLVAPVLALPLLLIFLLLTLPSGGGRRRHPAKECDDDETE